MLDGVIATFIEETLSGPFGKEYFETYIFCLKEVNHEPANVSFFEGSSPSLVFPLALVLHGSCNGKSVVFQILVSICLGYLGVSKECAPHKLFHLPSIVSTKMTSTLLFKKLSSFFKPATNNNGSRNYYCCC